MKRNILLLLLLSAILPVSSCKKFLEEQSQTDIIPKSASSLNELLIGAAYTSNGGVDATLRLIDDNIAEDKFFLTNEMFPAYTWQPQTVGKSERVAGSVIWLSLYPMILGCNSVLQYAPKVTGTTAEIENVEGQAYLLRAYYYFQLVNLYGKPYSDRLSNPSADLAVPLMLSADLSFEGKRRNTVAEVYQQILQDLDKGIVLLERNGKNNNVFRINHIAGYLLASRVHLQMGNWQKAIDAANEVLNRKSELMDLPNWGTPDQNNKPIIDRENIESIWIYGPPYSVAFPSNSENLNYRLSENLLSGFENGDLRTSVYIKDRRSIKRPVLGIIKVAQSFRVAEALLNRAEAYAQLNKLGQAGNGQLALNDLNTLRKKRFRPDAYHDLVATDAEDLLKKCFDEKRRELFDEDCHRWFDLRRTGMPAINHVYYENNVQTAVYTLQERDPAYVLQIPRVAMERNPNLTPNPEPAPRTGH
ncbi:RagB/SusD family nutrient uptake outer membrane protein [Pedobacter nyackensis]|uniref:RagB/SusD family nutrient uptake outer membrane protein n=1 Tax=Pedobacter nyackensis TaxID=475255 RepID=UPI00292F6329|nr:RagB/SusD family nutrient uptake outer membrane protein [Pedobacter nyackensis]